MKEDESTETSECRMEYKADGNVQLSTEDGEPFLESDTNGEDLLWERGQYEVDQFCQDADDWDFDDI